MICSTSSKGSREKGEKGEGEEEGEEDICIEKTYRREREIVSSSYCICISLQFSRRREKETERTRDEGGGSEKTLESGLTSRLNLMQLGT